VQTYEPAVPLTDKEAKAQREVQTYLGQFLDDSGSWKDSLFQAVMSEVVSLSLISHDKVNRAYVLHSFVQDWARGMAPDEDFARECTTLVPALSADPRRRAEDYAHHREIELHVNELLSRGPTPNANNAWRFVNVYDDIGQLKKVEVLEVQVVEARKVALGEEHPLTMESISSLAGTYRQQYRLEDAEKMYLKVLDARKRTVGNNHPDTLATMHWLSDSYSQQGRLREAEALFMQVLNARKQVLREEHPDTLDTMHGLGVVYSKQGRQKEAEALFIQALNARKHVSV
jgi:tetratricopeptide (TPR) repeat protein